MNWIKVLLIAAVLALLIYLLLSRGSAQSRAWVKIGYLGFVVAGIYAVLRPDDTTVVANWLGVRRGTDLMLYVLIMVFAFTTLSTYMRFRDLELRYARLARVVALAQAQSPEPGGSARLDEGEPKLGPPHQHRGSARLDEGEPKL
ncbi:membrane protein [Mycobacterium novum]|uniref:Membrane protein n=1 Tax=Mycobacterium novum TaxID=2492438 RepID=A0A7I7JQB6_9MYCO|nr:membrane protein [Mycobacterium novum]